MQQQPGKTHTGADCYCDCHEVGVTAMHCAPCCDRCYEKYLDANGRLIGAPEPAQQPQK